MKEQREAGIRAVEPAQQVAELDLVVPVTTPDLTRAAVEAAGRMGGGLNASLRLIRIQVVPFPMELTQSPVYLDFLRSQLESYRSDLPLAAEIRLAREFEPGLLGTLTPDSIVVLASRKRLWRTRNERLAANLRKAGHNVVLVAVDATAVDAKSIGAKNEVRHA